MSSFQKIDGRELFNAMIEAAKNDLLFCVPQKARDILLENSEMTEVVLLGATPFSRTFISEARGVCRIVGVLDDFRAPSGDMFEGIPIIDTKSLLNISANSNELLTVSGCRYDRARRHFKLLASRNGIIHLNFEQGMRLFGLSPARDHRFEDWGPTIVARGSQWMHLAERMEDELSQQTMYCVLMSHLSCDPEWSLHTARQYCTLYFRSGLWRASQSERFVDCGASIAESTSALIDVSDGKFERIWMIEPDRENIKTLNKYLFGLEPSLRERISIHPNAVSDSNTRMAFRHEGGHGGSLDTKQLLPNEDFVDVVRLDDLLDESPTLIKMDIEGAELSALKGAAKIVTLAKPRLALSAYHRATDLLDLTELALKLNPNYRIGLRHHTEDRWDTCLYFF